MIYLDNAASSFPKPPAVASAMMRFMNEIGANPGRSGHRLSVEAARIIYDAREELASLFGLNDPLRVVLCSNATEALNLAINGFCRPGGHIITGPLEHNSVMRHLHRDELKEIEISIIPADEEGFILTAELEDIIKSNTTLIVVNHISNVSGAVQPIKEIGAIAKKNGVPFLIDASQSAGFIDVNLQRDNVDLLAFTGHKALFGPQGTGGLAISPDIDARLIKPIKCGGTGSKSEAEVQPEFLPDRFESGTPNTVGIAGLLEGVRYVKEAGIDLIRTKEKQLSKMLYDGLLDIEGIRFLSGISDRHSSVVSLTVDGITPSEIGQRLDEEFGICCRVGLHCSPAAHRHYGTIPQGTVRFSPGWFNTEAEIKQTIDAMHQIVKRNLQ